ncbi:ClpP class periplasmic serine protease [Burkholderiales bacterium JOSHI_001]|nr:ClpP class periplasmic serine protease [Burkholderiales bacterium JOSHI_001]
MRGDYMLSEYASTYWAMEPLRLNALTATMVSMFVNRRPDMQGEAWAQPAYAAPARKSPSTVPARGKGRGIYLITVGGMIVPRAGVVTDYCGGTSTQQVRAWLREALADDGVGQVLIEFNTPGGAVTDVLELGDDIRQAATRKPVIGIANHLAASAGYWLGAQCSQLYVAPSGEVGSIGVYTVHEDLSKALEAAGVKYTLISAGRFKTELHPYGAPDREALDFAQQGVDAHYTAFTQAVARGRGVSVDTVRTGMGQGRVLMAKPALSQRMVDGILTLDQLVGNMVSGAPGFGGASALASTSTPALPRPTIGSDRPALRRARMDLDLM